MKTNSQVRQSRSEDQEVAALNTRNARRRPSRSLEPTTEFGKTLRGLLGKAAIADKVNEEEFFAGAIYQLVKNRFGNDVAADFKSTFKLNMVDKPSKEKVASAERAAKETLRFFVDSTILTQEEASDIRSLAFQTAQLDRNDRFVWDSLGKTKADRSFASVQSLGQRRLEESGNDPVVSSSARRSRRSSYDGQEAGESRRSSSRLKRVG